MRRLGPRHPPSRQAVAQAVGGRWPPTGSVAQKFSVMLMTAGPITTTNSAGKMQNTIGISIFTGAFWARSWASWRRLMRISSAWARSTRPIDTPKVSAWRMASTNERSSGTLVRCVDGPHGVGPAGTGPDLAQHAGELVGQRAGHGGDGAVERLLEAETGLDADGEQVEHVGQLDPDLVLALLDLAVEDGVGTDDQAQRQQQADDAAAGSCPSRPSGFQKKTNQMIGTMATTVTTRMARKRSTASVGAVAGADELLADLVDVADRGEPPAEVGEAAEHRRDGPLGERGQQLLVADVLDLVAVELAQRVADDRLLVEPG